MAFILCLETTTTNCSVAIAVDDVSTTIPYCLDIMEDNSDSYSHGERLHVFINQILQRNTISRSQISAVAVSSGPGSYTGLRIGVAAAKGLCYALQVPLIAVDTLKSLSTQSVLDTDIVIPMLDARRMEVYASVYDNQKMQLKEPQPVILNEHSFANYIKEKSVDFIGTGVEKCEKVVSSNSQFNYTTALPTASTMCSEAIILYKKSDTVDVAYFEPFYLKEFKLI